MKFLIIALAYIGLATAAILPDSATQGPNPQDIATPEPEYIDIDEPELPIAPQSASLFSPVSRSVQTAYSVPSIQHQQNQFTPQISGHYHSKSGYQYRRPVYIRRVYRRRY